MSRTHIEDSYPLSPMQEGMLFHALYAPRAGVDLEQMLCVLREPLDVPRFRAAWEHVVAARPTLRTAFRHQDLDEPQQDVWRAVALSWAEHDLRALGEAEQEARLQAFLADDRRQGFDLTAPPLFRLTLFRAADAVYRFVWTFHHILLDGRSFPLVIQDVFAAYEALGEGRAPALPERRPYRDFIAWLRGRDPRASDDFWRDFLAGFRVPTPLLGGKGDVRSVEDIVYGEGALRLSRADSDALLAFGKAHRLTLNTLLQGAWALLLSRYAGEDDVVFGATRAGRRTALDGQGTEGMLGVFINTPPLRVPVPAQAELLPWLADLQARGRAQREHEHTPLVAIHAQSEVPRSAPLYDTLFIFEEKILGTVLRRQGGAWESRDFKILRKTNFPLFLVAYGEDELLLEIEFDRRRFDDATVARMLGHLATLLRGFVADPARRLAELPMLTAAEREQLLVTWNDTAPGGTAPPRATLHALFEAQVDRTPDATALVDEHLRWSYRELDARANRLAHHLRARGVGVETLVGLCVDRSADLVVALLAILKAGGAYVPLDPVYPAGRLVQILDDARVPLLVTQQRVRDKLPADAAPMVLLDADAGVIAAQSEARPASGAGPDSLAYVIYTSGSTGRPKGVAIEHHATAALVAWAKGVYGAEEIAGVLFATSVCFDLSLFELFLPLCSGTKLILAENALELPALPARDEVTLVNTVPTAIAELCRTGGIPASVRTVCLAGEPLTATLTAQVYAVPSVERVYNLYGPTEDTTYSTWTLCPRDGSAPTIGKPLAWGQAYLVDARMEPVAIGVVGEIYLGGEGLARGYLGRPDLTAERFVDNPFTPGTRLYKTGDLGRYRADGDIEFLGRADFQVKVRGFRIELGEIEAVLLQHPGVRETVVVAREDAPGDKRVVAYVVPAEERAGAAELRVFLRDKLPEYMVPAAFVMLEALPLTPNGKVDRKALPAPEGLTSERARVLPRGPVEEAIAAVFAEVLKLAPEGVGAHDGFFELGGHSLLAAQAVARVRAAFGVELAVRAVFDAPTVAELAARVEAALHATPGEAAPPLVHGAGAPVLSFAQQRLWVLDQLEPGDPAYVIFRAVRLRGALDAEALGRALTEIVRRHEVLRTTLAAVDGEPAPALLPADAVPLPVANLTALPPLEREAELTRALTAEAAQSFDLAAGPLLRARLFALAEDDHALVLTMHHIVSDAWTLGVLNDELGALYQAFTAGAPSPLPELPIQYADYARWQRRWMDGAVLDGELGYWRGRLAGAPQALDLPSDRRRPPVESHRGARAAVALSPELSAALKDLSRREGVTPFMTLLAAFEVLLHRYTGQTDLLVGTPIANRAQTATEKLCGLFLNTLVLRAEIDPEQPFRALLRGVREAALGAYAHQDLPFERLVTELSPERDRSRSPLFQVMFTLQNASSGDFTLPGLGAAPVRVEIATSKFDLTLLLTDRHEAIDGFFEYATDLFDAATVARLAAHFTTLLAAAVAAPETPVQALPLLPAAERQQVLAGWNATAHAYPEDALIHEVFAAQAARTPDAVALRFEGGEVTYRDLDQRSNQLAHALRKRGVGPDALVGVFCERSVEMVVALYGILKAGGAYLPLDPDYPADRLAFMLADARPGVILTQAHLAAQLPASSAALLRLDSEWSTLAAEPTHAPARDGLTLEHLAYVIYTSGSTGRPKGAMNAHRGILNRLSWMQRAYALTPSDTVLQKTPFSFDVSVWEFFWPLMFGARLVVARPDGHRDPAYLAQLLRDEGVTTLHFVPSMLAVFLDEPSVEQCRSVRQVMCSGEALPAALAERFFARLPGVALHNLYGPTECAVDVTAWTCQPGAALVPIGRPIDNTRIYVLDGRLAPVPVGVPGDLYIAGVQVGRGYLDRDELTAERFLADPFAPEGGPTGGLPAPRMYKSGDVARWLADGSLEYLGRSDFQVKIRGLRIELGEIEAALTAHPAVREAVVLAREDRPGQKRLVAYLVGAEGQVPTAEALRGALAEALPDYMVPAAFVVLPALPLTASGKVDRRALPAPEEGSRAEAAADYTAPGTPAEEALARIWAAVLRVPRVGVHDNFFEIGGDSILGIQIVARAQQAGLSLTPRQMFQHQTIAELAAVAGAVETVRAEQGPVVGPTPILPIARWWLEGAPRGYSHYNQAFLLTSAEPLDAAALADTVAALLAHHDALRVRLDRAGAELRLAEPGQPPPFTHVHLGHLPEAEQAAALERAAAEAQQGLDLSRGPACAVVLFDLGGGQPQRLLVVIHHLAVDGVSWRILFEDLWSAYEQRRRGEPVALRPKTTSVRRWAELLAEHARTPALLAEEAFWTAAAERRPGRLPLDATTGENTEASTQRLSVELSVEETTQLLREVPEAYGTQINDVLLAALAEALAAWTGAPDVLVDLEGHGREDVFAGADLTRTVGWFTALFPVALRHDAQAGPGERLRSIKEQLRRIPGRGLGHGLLRYLGPADVAARLAALPQAELIFNYHGQVDQVLPEGSPFHLAAESSGPAQSPEALRPHLVEVIGRVTAGRLTVRFTYSENRHHAATIAALAEGFRAALRALVAHAAAKDAGGYTPSDLRRVRLPQASVDALAAQAAQDAAGAPRGKNLDDVYPLSPLQQGLLFHTLMSEGRDTYVVSLDWTLEGPLDVAAFRAAWQAVIDRHAILRSAVVVEGLEVPLQVVRRSVPVPVEEIDLRGLGAAEQEARAARFLAEDRRRGFDVTRAPLLRLSLLRLRDDAYRFFWSMHHLVVDGWSLPLLTREVFAHYEAFHAGRALRLPAPRPYGDYIDWLAGRGRAPADAFWRAQLHDVTAPTPLGVDRPAADRAEESFGEARLGLSGDETAALVAFARRHRLTVSTLVQGAWALLLSRYGGERDVVFGATVSGRSAPLSGIEGMVGLFINTIPVRVSVPAGADVLAWLGALQDQQAELRDFEHTPLLDAQAQSGVPRGTPLFESLVVFENYPLDESLTRGHAGVAVTRARAVETPAYPLTVIAVLRATLDLRVGYDQRRFDDATVERLVGHLANLLRALAGAAPSARLEDLALLSFAERQQVLAGWNDTAHAYPEDARIHEVFAAQAARTPDAVALRFEGREVSYRDLDQRANQLAHALRRRGVGPDSLVGVFCERSVEMVVALYGILKAGGAYLPLDPDYPADRLAFMLADARPGVILTQAHLAAQLPASSAALLRLDSEWSTLAAEPTHAPARDGLTLEHLAYVIYTSGSTGRPKGAMNAHRGILNRLSWMQRAYALTPSDTVLQKTPFSFDVSVWEFFWPLMFGARLVVARPDGHRDPAYLAQLLRDEGVTTLHFVPSMLAVFLDEPSVEQCRSVRQVMCSGEALPAALAERFFARLPGVALHNLYGPTECAVDVTAWTCQPGAALVPIGRPIDNTRIYVLDPRLAPVPVGVPGDLYIAGVQVGRGYLDRDELTAERFLADPFAPEGGPTGGLPAPRMYKSGDVARWLPDGSLEYLGRSDFQVKIRGLRIELGEIEAALAAHPAVREAVVLAREDQPGDKRLVAYLVDAADPGAADAELSAALGARLPAYMVPAVFVRQAALPLTASGKVDRKALPAPSQRGPEGGHVAPRGPIEEAIAAVFSEVLKVARVGAHDDFFALGGHSLAATQAVTRLRSALGVDVALRALFEAPTPAELGALLDEALRAGRADTIPPLVRVPRDGALVPSFGQERLWFLHQLDPADPAYVITVSFRIGGPLDVPALERTLRELTRRHEVLRTTLASVDGRPVQVIHDDIGLTLPVTRWEGMLAADRDEAIRAEARVEMARPFDLAMPLVRARLVALDPDDHVLFLGMHHVVFDAWSQGVLHRELSALYGAFHAGAPSPLPELPIQYADYAAWQRRFLSGETLDRQIAYWKDQLAGAPAALELPTDRPRPPVRSSRGAPLRFSLGVELTTALKDLARREGVTLFMTLLAAYDLLLSRYSGQDDIVVGSPIAGRTRAESEALIGFFLNTLVFRTRLDGVGTFRELLGRVRATCLSAYAHQDMPFERLVQEIRPDQDPSRSPVFQVILNLQNTPVEALDVAGLTFTPVASPSSTVKVDITLIMAERQGSLLGFLEYSTDLFDAPTLERFVGHFRILLEGVVADAGRPLAALPLLAEDERRRVLHGWNDTSLPFPAGETVASLFAAQAARTPDALALVAGEARLTFRQLDARANRLARHLRGLGVVPDSVVGLCLDRSAELIVGLLGILKAGGGYVPLDPTYPEARIGQILAEAGAHLVVTRDSLTGVVPREAVRRVRLDGDATAIDVESGAPFDGGAGPENLCYVLFTSGSTGKPKGVAIEHRHLVNYVRGVSEKLALPAGASFAHVSTFSADLGNTVLFPPLCLGGALHVIAQELTTDPDGLGAYFAREGIDCLKIVPSHLSALLSGARPERVLPRRLLVLGGEASSWELVERIERLSPATRIMNHYGPTETTVGVLTFPVDGAQRTPTAIVPLGRPLPNSRVYLLDPGLEPVPAGVPGEVYIGGAGVARGYLGRPDLTAERFLRDPFVADPAARMYRTGDRARHLPDGALLFLGRIDHQVKIRGFRIELGEIEAAINAHAGVREAVVLVHEETPGDKRLVAYVVPRPAEGPSPDETKRYLAERLPEYMVPSVVHIIDAVPLNANGKIDRQALAAIEIETAGDEHTGPRTPTEEVLTAIWTDVFERERISIHDRFADLGGHSLLAIQIIARARDAFQADVPLRAIFEAPTIAGLAERIDEAVREDDGLAAPPVVPVPRDGPLPLSFSQERLWFLDRLEPDSAAYNVPVGMRLGGRVDAPALERALRELCRRHEVLRTTFATVDGKPVPVIHEVTLQLALDDLSALPDATRETVARREVEVEAQRPFDLARGPLLRARLLRLAADDHVLLLTMHHIVSDAWTRGILSHEIATLYAAYHEGRPHGLPELPVQYGDYAAWQRAWLSGAVEDRLLAYWKKQLGGAPAAIELPTDRPRPPVLSGRGGRRSLDLPLGLSRALGELARRESATLFMTMLAGFYVLLHRYSNQDDLSIGTPVANRTRAETEGLIGFFVNTLVLRAQLGADLTFRELLGRVRETAIGGYAHQEMPFERLVTELAPGRDLSRTPLFQVMFTLQNEPLEAISLSGVTMRPFGAASGTAKFDLMLAMTQGPKALHALLEYSTDLFDGATMDRLLGHLQVLLEGIAADPDQRLADLPLLPEAERHQLLAEWNPTSADHPRHLCVHERFEAQVDATPDAPAATFEAETLTYRALDARANQVAHHLRALGVGPGSLVGLCTERSLDMLVGLLGILKAGGAYLPLDPEYPRERLAFMVEDARVPVVLTQAHVAAVLPDHGAVLVRLDADRATLAAQPTSRPAPSATPDGLAYVIYTSGSTGKPKGAMVTHHNVVRLFQATDAWYRFGPGDVWTMFHSYAFDFSVWEIWGALFHGGRVVIVPYWMSRDPEAFHALLGQEGVTVLNQTPSAFRQLMRVDEAATVAARARLALRYVIFGGEALDLGDLRAWWERHGDKHPQLVNMYGITETTVHVTYRPVGLADLDRPWSSVIGRAIPDLQVYVLDAARHLAPVGVPGELYVGGAGVARGYLNRPELTQERFLPDPFRAGGSLLYKTGDLGRYLASGDLEYLGRIDHQVKIRGFRIELGEIEAMLDTHPAVREAVVLAREDQPGEKRLVAYLVCREGAAPTTADLRAFVKQKLPDVMVPAAFVLLDALPLTSNGKVDRRALPAPEEGERASTGSAYAAPTSAAEDTLAGIWAAVLRLEKVGVHDNFFELGGDSILSIQIVARATAAGLRITPKQLFLHQTVAELATVAGTTEAVDAEQGAVTGPVPLTPVAAWFLAQNVAEPHHHNQAMFLEVREPLHGPALEAALTCLLEHHDMLRVRLTREGGAHRLAIAPPGGPAPLTRVDVSALAGAEQRAVIEREAAAAQASLDLEAGPVARVTWFDLGPDAPARLLLVVHHLAVDGVSWRILLEDLWTAYGQARRGEPVQLAPKTTSFQRWAEKLGAHARGEALREEEAFWLDGARGDVGRLPVERRGDNLEGAARVVTVELSAAETEQLLREVPEVYRTQVNDLLLTAFAQAMAPWVGSRRVLVDLEGHGREELFPDVDLTRTVGWFTAIYPVVLELDPRAPPGEAIQAVKEQLRGIPGRGLGYGLLRYLRAGEAVATRLAALPAAEVSFNYLGQFDQALPDASFGFARESMGPGYSPRARRAYTLDVQASVRAGVLRIRVTYGEDRHERATIEALAARFLAALGALIAHCLSPEAGGYTPSDFQKADLSQEDLGDVLDQLEDEE
jgi:amino acid adenylation domain-containing protein/non-ribosomal peptide synthase protein (TIGR01720 family)